MPSLAVDNVDGATLVVAPNAYQFIRIIGIDLTASADADVVSLKSGSTVKWSTYAMNRSDGGGIVPSNIGPQTPIDLNNGEALVLGVGGGATVKGSIEWIVKGRPNTALAPLG